MTCLPRGKLSTYSPHSMASGCLLPITILPLVMVTIACNTRADHLLALLGQLVPHPLEADLLCGGWTLCIWAPQSACLRLIDTMENLLLGLALRHLVPHPLCMSANLKVTAWRYTNLGNNVVAAVPFRATWGCSQSAVGKKVCISCGSTVVHLRLEYQPG